MCGASGAMNDTLAAEQNLSSQMSQNYGTIFGENQNILGSLTQALSPIVQAGPNQQGFSQPELTAMQTSAQNNAAQAGQNAAIAAGAKEASAGGGNAFLPSGANQQVNAMINTQAGLQNASAQNAITQANYATGRQNFFGAEGALASAPQTLDTTATQAGEGASNSLQTTMQGANFVNQANTAWLSSLGGILGGIGGLATGIGNL